MFFFFFVVKPNIIAIESDPKIAIIDKKLEISCKADGVPKPSYIIYHNGTQRFTGAKVEVQVIKSVEHNDARIIHVLQATFLEMIHGALI